MTHMMSQPFAVPAIIIVVVCIPLILQLVQRNKYYGIRTRKTLSADSVWYPANRFLGAALLVAGGIYLVVASVWPHVDPANLTTLAIHIAAFGVSVFFAIVLSLKFIDKL